MEPMKDNIRQWPKGLYRASTSGARGQHDIMQINPQIRYKSSVWRIPHTSFVHDLHVSSLIYSQIGILTQWNTSQECRQPWPSMFITLSSQTPPHVVCFTDWLYFAGKFTSMAFQSQLYDHPMAKNSNTMTINTVLIFAHITTMYAKL